MAQVSSQRVHGRILEIDILRGVAILLVLGFHSPDVPGQVGRLHALDALMHRVGWTGVDLFFVLSGYLIGGLLFAEIRRYGDLDVRRFVMRRMLRIWPPFYVLLAYVFARAAIDTKGDFALAWSGVWPALVHIQNFIPCSRDQLWSLAVEEHFYLMLPFFLWFAVRRRHTNGDLRAVPMMCWFLAVGCLSLRLVLVLFTSVKVRYMTFTLLDSLFFGVTLAYLREYRPGILDEVSKRRKLLLALICLFLSPAVWENGDGVFQRTFGYACLYLGYGLLLIYVVHAPPDAGTRRLTNWKPLSWAARTLGFVGTYSYSIYLWHRDTSWGAYELASSVGRTLKLPGELAWILGTSAYVGASVGSGIVLGWLIEAPVQRLRERFFPPSRHLAPGALPGAVTASVEVGR